MKKKKRQINKVKTMEMSGLPLKDKVRKEHINDSLKVAPIDNKLRKTCLGGLVILVENQT